MADGKQTKQVGDGFYYCFIVYSRFEIQTTALRNFVYISKNVAS